MVLLQTSYPLCRRILIIGNVPKHNNFLILISYYFFEKGSGSAFRYACVTSFVTISTMKHGMSIVYTYLCSWIVPHRRPPSTAEFWLEQRPNSVLFAYIVIQYIKDKNDVKSDLFFSAWVTSRISRIVGI